MEKLERAEGNVEQEKVMAVVEACGKSTIRSDRLSSLESIIGCLREAMARVLSYYFSPTFKASDSSKT